MNKFLVVTTPVFGLMAVQVLALRADEASDKLTKQAEARYTGIK